jgi:hypothetical protein
MGQKTPDISVIIPSHNRLWALPQAIASCRTTRCCTEIIVIDDGSTDGTWSWLQNQEDVIAIRTDNWGKCWAVNTAFAVAAGEFIRFLDSDDYLLVGANDRQLALARAESADIVVAGYVFMEHTTGKKIEVPWADTDDFVCSQITADSFYSAYLIRRSFVSCIPHREEFPHNDSMFVIELALAKPTITVDDSFSVVYRNHDLPRLSQFEGFEAAVAAWRSIVMYKKTLALLQQRGECTERRMHAVLTGLWHAARELAPWDNRDAAVLVAWISRQDANFRPPVSRVISCLYGLIGFGITERIVAIGRAVRMRVISLGRGRRSN